MQVNVGNLERFARIVVGGVETCGQLSGYLEQSGVVRHEVTVLQQGRVRGMLQMRTVAVRDGRMLGDLPRREVMHAKRASG